jgi:hypothetical protein
MTVQARIYSGQWIGDCSRPGCSNAEWLLEGDRAYGTPLPVFRCSYCLQLDMIEWPDPEFVRDAMAVLAVRPLPHTRNWYPPEHPEAVKVGLPHGQSVDDLRDENRDHGVPVPA